MDKECEFTEQMGVDEVDHFARWRKMSYQNGTRNFSKGARAKITTENNQQVFGIVNFFKTKVGAAQCHIYLQEENITFIKKHRGCVCYMSVCMRACFQGMFFAAPTTTTTTTNQTTRFCFFCENVFCILEVDEDGGTVGGADSEWVSVRREPPEVYGAGDSALALFPINQLEMEEVNTVSRLV